jgi:hypothetical protein
VSSLNWETGTFEWLASKLSKQVQQIIIISILKSGFGQFFVRDTLLCPLRTGTI